MFRFIKEAVGVVIPKEHNISLNKAVTCMIYCMDKTESLTERFDSFDLAKMAKSIKKDILKNKKYIGDQTSVLDYASLYEDIYNGKSILFLKAYQDYIGPIE